MMGAPVPPHALSRHDGQANFSALTVIAESPLDRNLLYTGSDDGTLQRTRDGGQHWTNLTANVTGLPPMLNISGIVASKHAAGRVYLTVDGHFDDRYDPFVFVSEDYGQTWRAIGAGLPQASVHRIREHPANPNLLVVGTETGVYASFDRGGRWTTLGTDLPRVPGLRSAVSGKRRRSGSRHPRAQHLGPRSYRGAGANDPGDDERRRTPVSDPAGASHEHVTRANTGSAPGEFFAPNPPAGAVVSYYLPQENPGGVHIAIWDAAGKTRAHAPCALTGGPESRLLGLAAGTGNSGESAARRGELRGARGTGGSPLAPPGKYTVVLTPAGALPMKSELIVQPDPRSRISEPDRRARESAISSAYTLQRQLRGARQAAQTLGIQIAAMRGAISGEAVATAGSRRTRRLRERWGKSTQPSRARRGRRTRSTPTKACRPPRNYASWSGRGKTRWRALRRSIASSRTICRNCTRPPDPRRDGRPSKPSIPKR